MSLLNSKYGNKMLSYFLTAFQGKTKIFVIKGIELANFKLFSEELIL